VKWRLSRGGCIGVCVCVRACGSGRVCIFVVKYVDVCVCTCANSRAHAYALRKSII